MSAETDSMNQEPEDEERPLLYHLIELRTRLLRAAISVVVVFIALYPFADHLYSWLSGPLRAALPKGATMIATQVASPFLVPMKLALLVAVFICIPYVLYQLWAFVAPGLYRHERRMIWPLLVSSTALFYIGALFAYFVVFPLVFHFFVATTPKGVAMMTDISEYLSFVMTLFFAFGCAFQVPIATILLVWTGIVSRDKLTTKRPYVVVLAFVVGMLLTPPDVVSQTMLAIPIWLLYEVGVYASRWFVPEAREEEQTDTE